MKFGFLFSVMSLTAISNSQTTREHWFNPERTVKELYIYNDTIMYSTGVLGQDGNWILPPKFNRVEINSDRIAAAKNNDKFFALFTIKGQQLTPFIFDDIDLSDYTYHPDRPIRAKLNGLTTFIDSIGNSVFPDSCDDMYCDYWGFLHFTKNGENCIMTLDKKTVFCGEADHILHVVEKQLFIVYHNGKANLYNYSGKLTKLYPFAADPTTMEMIHYPYAKFESNGLFGIRRVTDGYITVRPKYTSLHVPYYDTTTVLVEVNGKYGMTDHFGNMIIPIVHDAYDYDYKNVSLRKDSLWAFFNHSGKRLTDYIYETVYFRAWGSAMVRKNGRCILVDSMVRPLSAEYDDFRIASGGVHDPWFVINNGKTGLIDYLGREKIPCKYDALTLSRIHLLIAKENNKYGVLDTNGKIVIPFEYDEIAFDNFDEFSYMYPHDMMLRLKKGEFYGLADTSGKIIFPVKYGYITYDYGTAIIYNYKPLTDGSVYFPERIQKKGIFPVSAAPRVAEDEEITLPYDDVLHIFPNGAVIFYLNGRKGYLGVDGKEKWLQ
jgi:hypothetical protein